jgi:hypothetical protein
LVVPDRTARHNPLCGFFKRPFVIGVNACVRAPRQGISWTVVDASFSVVPAVKHWLTMRSCPLRWVTI